MNTQYNNIEKLNESNSVLNKKELYKMIKPD